VTPKKKEVAPRRITNGWLSPKFKVVYSASAKNEDPELKQSLPNTTDRMSFVSDIADDFNRLMSTKRSYMEGELKKFRPGSYHEACWNAAAMFLHAVRSGNRLLFEIKLHG
jgi:hypothetical protein